MFMKEQPCTVFKNEIRAITLPQAADAAFSVAGYCGGNEAGGHKGSPRGFSVVRHFNDIGGKGVERQLHQRPDIKTADLRHNLIILLEPLGCLHIVQGHRTVPNGLEAPHPSKSMGPGNILTLGPDLAPLLCGKGTGMEVGMGSVDKFRLLCGGTVMNSLTEAQVLIHTMLPPFSMGCPSGP